MYTANVRKNTIYCTLNKYKMYVLYEYNVHYIYNKMYISVIWSCTPIFATQKEGEPSKRERTAGVLPLWGDGRGGYKKTLWMSDVRQFATGVRWQSCRSLAAGVRQRYCFSSIMKNHASPPVGGDGRGEVKKGFVRAKNIPPLLIS